MELGDQALLNQLLLQAPVGTLAVNVAQAPVAGLLPFALDLDGPAILILASDLAKHTAGLQNDTPYSFLIHGPTPENVDPFQIGRVSLQGFVELVGRQNAAFSEVRAKFVAKYPKHAVLIDFQDFNFYRLNIDNGRFVAGFGKSYNLTAQSILAAVVRAD